MNAQDIILNSRLLHVRELKTEVDRLKAENARLRDENESWRNHFDLALLAVDDLQRLPETGTLVIWDGWNAILSADKVAHTREELEASAREYLAAHPSDRVWIVYDGPRAHTREETRLRITYTGGTGLHRADRFICDYVRMAGRLGKSNRLKVQTADRDFKREIDRLLT